MDESRSGSAVTTSSNAGRKDWTVQATRPVGSAYGGNRSNRYGRRPTPWPDANPGPEAMGHLLARHRANATQSSEEGDSAEPLPFYRKRRSRPTRSNATRSSEEDEIAAPLPVPRPRLSKPTRSNASEGDDIAAPLPAPQEHPSKPTSYNASQPSGDDDVSPPPIPPRNPLRLTFAPDTQWRPKDFRGKRKKSRFDSLQPEAGHYVLGGRKLSSDGSDTAGPANPASAGTEIVPENLPASAGSNPGHNLLNMLGQLPGKTVKRPSAAGLEPNSQPRARDGSRPTTGTEEVNTGQAIHDVLDMYPGDPTRSSARRSIIVVPTIPDDIGVLPTTYVDDDGCPGPSSRTKSSRPTSIEEEQSDVLERSPTDTRCPQLPETFQGSPRGISSLDFAMNNFSL